jgi:LPS export ABC transporter protein LptC
MSTRSILIIIVLMIAAIASWYVALQDDSDGAAAGTNSGLQRGYYLQSARILGTDVDGGLLYEIEADRAEQQDNNQIAFTNVRISYSPQTNVPWIVTADTATIDQGDERVILRGHVKATSGGADTDTEIRTQFLELYPENYLAETDQRVQIRIGPRSLTATGMLASLQDNRLELKSNVSGKFLP